MSLPSRDKSLVITIFALLLGVLYMRMYEEATVENFEQQQTKKAQAIAKRCSTYFLDKLNLNKDLLPRIKEIDEIAGYTKEIVWAENKMPAGIPVFTGIVKFQSAIPREIPRFFLLIRKALSHKIISQL